MPVGLSSFEKIRESSAYYVDKTGFITELIDSEANVTLFTRPRRFGKTLIMRMLESFFDIGKDSRVLFENLKVSENREICDRYMNQYPVLFLTLKEIQGRNFKLALAMLKNNISVLCKKYLFLLDSDKISDSDKKVFSRLDEGIAEESEISSALSTLVRLLHIYYDRPVILLIDEYDVPLAKASDHGYYEEMLDVMRNLMQVLKDNDDLKFAVITGCLRISKESIFTGTNNFSVNTITSSYFNEYFGFTENEVKKLLKDVKAFGQYPVIREWYDGYNFGGIDIYCPWDVVNYVYEFLKGERNLPKCYWNNTSTNSIVRSFVDSFSDEVQEELESLLEGNPIHVSVKEDLTYDLLHSSKDNFWSILYLTGYLTSNDTDIISSGEVTLRIPNKEIQKIFTDTVREWFRDTVHTLNRKKMFDAIWAGDTEILTKQITKILVRTISYHDYREDFYHAFLAGIFTGAGYRVESNREHGEGRSDVVVKDNRNFRIAVFEIKYSNKKADLEKDCEKAIEQIKNRQYTADYEEDYDQILCYGIAFCKKRCRIKR